MGGTSVHRRERGSALPSLSMNEAILYTISHTIYFPWFVCPGSES